MKRIQNPSLFAALLAASLPAQTPSQAASTARPALVIIYPTAKLSVTSAGITVTGTTKDKVGVTNVLYQLNKTSKGSYTFTRDSPVGGLFVMHTTSPSDEAGTVVYCIVTFSAARAGTWFQTTVPRSGAEGIDFGTFTVQ
jgi:hypothetical protein